MSKTYKTSHYQLISAIEGKHFWFRARNELIAQRSSGRTFFEVGYGTGIVLSLFQSLGFIVSGTDVNPQAQKIASKRIGRKLFRRSIYSFSTIATYDVVGAFDVLEHQSREEAFIQACRRLLKRGGILLINVPAGKWLWSTLDQDAGHKRRYEANELKALLGKEGFRIIYLTYWGFITLPFYLLWRVQTRNLGAYLEVPAEPINSFMAALLALERFFLRFISLPFGSSIFVVALKVEQDFQQQ